VFAGRCSREELRRFYVEARALLFPGVEDFGIVPVEAQATGTPVIAYGAGGALETVIEGKTGLFFASATVDSLCEAMEQFEGMNWDSETVTLHAESFDVQRFRDRISAFVASCVSPR